MRTFEESKKERFVRQKPRFCNKEKSATEERRYLVLQRIAVLTVTCLRGKGWERHEILAAKDRGEKETKWLSINQYGS